MKEKDIREHINAFLRNKLQHLVVPASMGFGLMLGGCDGSSLGANPDGSGGVTSTYPSGGVAGGQGGLYGMAGFGSGGTAGGQGGLYGMAGFGSGGSGGSGGTTAAGGSLYGMGGYPSGGAGGSGGSRTSSFTGRGGVYGFPVTGGRGGGGVGAAGGSTSSGIRGTGGTVYGTGIFRDAAQPSDVATRGEVSESEAGASSDALTSEAGAVETEKDAGRDER